MMHQLYPINRYPWFDNVQIIEIDGCKIRCLTNEMALLNMIYHFSVHHSFRCLKWLVDICRMIVKYNDRMDWDLIYQASAHPNLRKLVGICLIMVRKYTGIETFGKYRVDHFIKSNTKISRYENMMFENVKQLKAVIQGRLVRMLLPATLSDKIKLLGYFLFDKDSIAHRITNTKQGVDLFLPLRLAGITIKDFFTGQNKN